MGKKIVLFASGSGSNVENIANYFTNSTVRIISVLTNNPDAFVVERSKNLGIPCSVFTKEELNSQEFVKKIQSLEPDLIVLAGFLLLIPDTLVSAFPNRIINIHPALLPKYGGKGMYGDNVHKSVYENREESTGISIHYVNNKYDDGDIIFQTSCVVNSNDLPKDIAGKVHDLEYKYFPEIIEKTLNNS